MRGIYQFRFFFKLIAYACCISLSISRLEAKKISAFYLLTAPLSVSGKTIPKGTLVELTGGDSQKISATSFKEQNKEWHEDAYLTVPKKSWDQVGKKLAARGFRGAEPIMQSANGEFFPVIAKKNPICLPEPVANRLQSDTEKIFVEAAPKKMISLPQNRSEPLPETPGITIVGKATRLLPLEPHTNSDVPTLTITGNATREKNEESTKTEEPVPAPVATSKSPPKKASATKVDNLAIKATYEQIMKDFRWVQKQKFWANGLRDKGSLAAAKLRLINELQAKAIQEGWSQERAVNLFVALTLFGEFRSERDRLEAHLFWATEVMKNRVNDPAFKNRLAIETIAPNGTRGWSYQKFDWLKGTEGGVAMARWQFSAWNVTPDNKNLKAILNPSREDEGVTAFKDIAKFMANYRNGAYTIDGPDPRPTYYISPKSQPDSVPFEIAIETLPPVLKTLVVDPEAFQGGI